MVVKHNERCKECKKHVFELLTNLFGEVKENYNLNLPNKPRSFKSSPYYSHLKDIHASLQSHRNHKNFIKSKKLPNIDFFIVDHEFNLEFDESQHFTAPRKLTLEKYPEELKLGFDKQRWINLCETLNKKDNNPVYRDEQRAWYDTLRDFVPSVLNHNPTVRIYAKDNVWCELDPDNAEDLKTFKNILKIKIYNYNSTIINQNPEYIDKNLLLADKQKRRLFQADDHSNIQLRFNKLGNLITHKITNGLEKIPLNWSLHKIGINYLDLNDPSVQQMIKYLVTPEMEIERIFNNLRYKYLKSIYKSKLKNPQEYINAKYNSAFQSLAGMNVYQGNAKKRKNNDEFWKDAGFEDPTITDISFETERNELKFILNYLRNFNTDPGRVYTELIAIKPGFHELYIHSDYFDKNAIPKGDKDRSEVFRLLRGVNSLDNSRVNKLEKLPHEINSKSYFTYASCNITEGPFVFRKSVDTSYYNEIRNIKSVEELKNLEGKFNILDYYHNRIHSLDELKNLLEDAKRYQGFVQG